MNFEQPSEQPTLTFEQLPVPLQEALRAVFALRESAIPVGKKGNFAFGYEEGEETANPLSLNLIVRGADLEKFIAGTPFEADKFSPLVSMFVSGGAVPKNQQIDFSFDVDGVLRKNRDSGSLANPEAEREARQKAAMRQYQEEHEPEELRKEDEERMAQRLQDMLSGKVISLPSDSEKLKSKQIAREMGADVANAEDIDLFASFLADERIVRFAQQERERLLRKKKKKM